jgi:multiple antibiotic resistance protein
VKDLLLVCRFIPFGFIALYPVVSPISSGLIFVSLVSNADHATKKMLSRKIAINSILFLVFVQLAGAYLLRLVGITLPIVQVVGGLVLGAMGWTLLNKPDSGASTATPVAASLESLQGMSFYPLTFPLSVGPGCIAVALTLGAHASSPLLLDTALAQLGLLIATVLIGIATYFGHAYADRITARLSAAETAGFVRLLSFVLMCIGGEITWNGIEGLLKTVTARSLGG